MNDINSEIYTDISIIISMMPEEMKNKINRNFIKFIENNKSKVYVSSINPKIPLKEQHIRKETKEMMGIIYRDYLCDDEERKKLLQEEKEELYRIEEEKKEKYNPSNIFKNDKNSNEAKVQQYALIETKNQKWYQKLFEFIRKIFKK